MHRISSTVHSLISLHLVVLLLCLSSTTLPATVYTSTTWYVDDDNIEGPWLGTSNAPFQFVQDALNHAQHQDYIYIKNGRYHEQLHINKTVTIIGEQAQHTILDGTNHQYACKIQSPSVSLTHLTIQNTTGSHPSAAVIITADVATLSNLFIRNTKTALSITNTSNHKINNCSIHNNGVGIILKHTTYIHLTGSLFAHNAQGLLAYTSSHITVTHSYFHTNGRSLVFTNTTHNTIHHCNISDNSVNLGGILLQNTYDTQIVNNNLHHNGQAITLHSAHNISIIKNQISRNTHFGIWINRNSRSISIQHNNITGNFRYALYLLQSSFCRIQNNNIKDSYLYALYNHDSSCDARHNYWGAPTGPTFTDLRAGRRISLLIGKTRFFPWNIHPLPNAGATWKTNEEYLNKTLTYPFSKHITLPGADQDHDQAPDWWEKKWNYPPDQWNNHLYLDPDTDGLNNIEECYTDSYGSNPYQKDIFIEIDWMKPQQKQVTNKPSPELINHTISLFKKHNITLHIDCGSLNGGECIPYAANFSFHTLHHFYWNYFLHQNINNPRKGIFHYGIICDWGPDVNFPYMGWNHLDSFLISAEWLQQKLPTTPRKNIIMGAIIHQLGHHLHLLADSYPGIDNTGTLIPMSIQWFKYRNYKSNMNYLYKYTLLTYSDGTNGQGDTNDWDHIDLSFFKNTTFKQSYINNNFYSTLHR